MNRRITTGQLKSALEGKFRFEQERKRTRAGHDTYALRVDGRKVATTRFSRRLKSDILGRALLRRIANQLRIFGSIDPLVGMVACSVSYEDYLAILRAGRFLD